MSLVTTNLAALEETQNLCQVLMRTPHYAKLGQEGIFAVVAKAKSLNVDPMDALNGGLYTVQGKVEMSSAMMNQLIRQCGHSIMRDAKSNDAMCILHGKRADNGDTWTESFSIEEAKRAGIYNDRGPWGKYPRDMLFARALSRLARQLFPDVIKGCYVEGEIAQIKIEDSKQEIQITISREEADELEVLLNRVPEYKDQVMKFLIDSFGIKSLCEITPQLKQRIQSGALKKITEIKEVELQEVKEEQTA